MGVTPYNLVFGLEDVIPVEIGVMHYDREINQEELRTNLDLLIERHELATVREVKYKEVMTRYYNKRVHNIQFRIGNLTRTWKFSLKVATR